MKTTGATWKAYLESWPKGQYYDDCDETINGKSVHDADSPLDTPDDAVVEFTCGWVFPSETAREGFDLIEHFQQWLTAQTTAFVVCEVPKAKVEQLLAFVATLGGRVRTDEEDPQHG